MSARSSEMFIAMLHGNRDVCFERGQKVCENTTCSKYSKPQTLKNEELVHSPPKRLDGTLHLREDMLNLLRFHRVDKMKPDRMSFGS